VEDENCLGEPWLRDLTLRAGPKVFKDTEFHREYKKLSGQDSDPLMPEEMENAIEKRRATPK